MIQILICDKIYITPEIKRKKRLYKIYFILSVILLISLLVYYIYQEYDRNVSEQVSQEILQGLSIPSYNVAGIPEIEDDTRISVEDNVIVVVLNDEPGEEINIDELVSNAEVQIMQNQERDIVAMPQKYTAKDGTEYYTIATITIPKLGITYPVLSDWNYDLLKVAPCRFHGPENPNEVGNFCIIGHNYRNDKFFSKLDTLDKMDVIQIQDMTGRTVEYAIYEKYVVDPNDVSCTSQLTNGRKEITLITCYNSGKQRTIIKATEVK